MTTKRLRRIVREPRGVHLSPTTWRGFVRPFCPDYEGLIRTLLRQGTPERVYFMELFLDGPICAGADRHFGITSHLDPRDPDYDLKAHIAIQQFLGYDYVGVPVGGLSLQYKRNETDNTVAGATNAKRAWMEEGLGPIGSWAGLTSISCAAPTRPPSAAGFATLWTSASRAAATRSAAATRWPITFRWPTT